MNTILGVLVKDDETGEVSLIPVSLTGGQSMPSGKIVKQPTPEEDGIAKEQRKDFSLDGRLKEHKEVSEKVR